MSNFLDQIIFTAKTYLESRLAIRRQYDSDRLVRTQTWRLRRLVSYAYHNIKYYHELFETMGLRPEDIQSGWDLAKIPVLTKEELRGRFWDFLPRVLPECRVSRTSGSTGVPVCILSDRKSRSFNSAAVIRYRRALGIGFWGQSILTPLKTAKDPCDKKPHWTFLQGLHKTYYVNPYVNSDANIRYAGNLLARMNGAALIGITPAITRLAHNIRDGIFPFFQPKAILTLGEVMRPEVREVLESTFKAKVGDIYACNEGGDIAWQCLDGKGYHINIDNVVVELLQDGNTVPEGEVGEVVITNLNRYAMPIIRYKNGDLGRYCTGNCPCGCQLPMLAEVIGRSGEDICLPNGTSIPWNQLKSLMNHPHIRQFQIVQNPDAGLTIKYINEPGVEIEPLENLIIRRYRDLLGDSIPINTEMVKEIPPSPSGKIKLVISHFKIS